RDRQGAGEMMLQRKRWMRHRTTHNYMSLCAVFVALIALIVSDRATAAVTIYGGPTYNSSTGSGYLNGSAFALSGTAIGFAERYSATNNMGYRAVRWDSSGASATEMGSVGINPSGYGWVVPRAVNVFGAAVGEADKWVFFNSMGSRAVRWNSAGVATELGTLGTSSSGYTNGYAYGINSAGVAVGSCEDWQDNLNKGTLAVRWDASTTSPTPLAVLSDDASGV